MHTLQCPGRPARQKSETAGKTRLDAAGINMISGHLLTIYTYIQVYIYIYTVKVKIISPLYDIEQNS